MTNSAQGIDGCRDGWVHVTLNGEVQVRRLERIDAVTGRFGVDMPVGLKARGWRDADREARRMLGRRGASVFLVPPRPVLELDDYPKALERCRSLTGLGCSKQVWNLREKILEVDRLRDRPVEVHPELAFRALAGSDLPPKTRWEGLMARVRLLRAQGIVLPERFPGSDKVAPDDVVDAAVVAWVMAKPAAWRRCGDPTERDDKGKPIEIIYRAA